MGVLLVAGAKARYIVLITFLSIATVAGGVRRAIGQRLPGRAHPRPVQPARTPAAMPPTRPRTRMRAIGTGGIWGKGWLQGPLTNGRDIPVHVGRLPVRRRRRAVRSRRLCASCSGCSRSCCVRIWRIAHLSRDPFGTYLCAGVFTMMLWQTFQNIGMTLRIMPVTGLPLPFISYGGSGLIVYFAMFGLVQSVHMRRMR